MIQSRENVPHKILPVLNSCLQMAEMKFIHILASFVCTSRLNRGGKGIDGSGDTVPRVLLWQKLLAHNINDNLLTVIRNLYNAAKSAVRLGRHTSTFFDCGIGTKALKYEGSEGTFCR